MEETLFQKRIRLANEAIRLEEPERVPIWINFGTTPYRLSSEECSYRDVMYHPEKASKALIQFHQEFQPDIMLVNLLNGRADEIAGTRYIDWPGRPGTKVPDDSIYQVHEYEFMKQDEYEEMLQDFTGFMLHKFIPRAFPGLSGLADVLNPAPTGMMYIGQMRNLLTPKAIESYEKLISIAKELQVSNEWMQKTQKTLAEMGFPPMMTGVGLVPYDTLSNYFRGTLGSFDDLVDEDIVPYMQRAVDMFADLQIKNLQYLKYAPLPVKRVMFWMHKGMDGFMSSEQFENLYWKPFLKVIYALTDMGVTPILYTEGDYSKRVNEMTDLPEKKCVVHFEKVNLEHAKKTIGQHTCITGNFPVYLLEYGTVEQVIEEAKRQIDIGAAGGGFIFETNASIENVKRENLAALYDTVRKYSKK